MGSAVAHAQARGLVQGDVCARVIARFLWAAPIAFVPGDAVGVAVRQLEELSHRRLGTPITDPD